MLKSVGTRCFVSTPRTNKLQTRAASQLSACCRPCALQVLDEPTNHLDIPSKETLEEAVRAFEGAVIAVSHDRYFLRQIATRVRSAGGA